MTVSVAYYWDRVDEGKCVAALSCREPAVPGNRHCEAHLAKRRAKVGYKGGLSGGFAPAKVEFKGEALTVAQWAERMGLTTRRMRERLARWPIERALGFHKTELRKEAGLMAKPVEMITHDGRTQTVVAWAMERGVSPTSMYRRLREYPLAEALTMPAGFGRTGRPRGRPRKDDDYPMVSLPSGPEHCGRCGLRGEHECLPDISFYASRRPGGRGDASTDVTRKGVGKR